MKHIKFKLLLIVLGLTFIDATNSFAQKIKLVRGSLKNLEGIKSYYIKFRYDSMVIGETQPEKEYLLKKRNDWEEKEPGKGSLFVTMWFEDRWRLYQPAFTKSFEEFSGVTLGDKEAQYTLILKTKRTEGGWSIGVMAHPGDLDGELWIVETTDNTKVIAKIVFFRLAGKVTSTDDFQITERIESAYTIAGKGLGDFMKRKTR